MATLKQAAAQQILTYPYIDNLEDYQDIKEIGSGTYGIVYKGQCKKTKKSVALKKILVNEKDGGFPKASINEISILQNLTHENIVQLLGMCYSPMENPCQSDFYLVFEFCDYELNNIIQNKEIKLTLESIKCIMSQTLTGLAFLHDNDIIHRDLKPANILMTKNGILKIADFGLSKVIKPRENNQQNGNTNHYVTRWYRAPELLLGNQRYDKAIDLWSVGCIFAELWTRTPIIQGNDEEHQLKLIFALRCIIEQPKVQGSSLNFHIPKGLINYKTYIPQSETIDFIDQFLIFDCKQRINVKTAINSSFLQPKPSSEVLRLLLSKYSTVLEPTEASSNTTQTQSNVPHGPKMPYVPEVF